MNTEPSQREEAPERLMKIRERWRLTPYRPPFKTCKDDIDFLLSLLDSQGDATKERDEWKEFAEECKEGIRASHRILDEFGVPREDAWLQETDGKNYGIEEVVEYSVHERIKMLPPFAALRMRERCVDRVKKMGQRWQDQRLREKRDLMEHAAMILGAKAEAAYEITRVLESLTLDGEKEQ